MNAVGAATQSFDASTTASGKVAQQLVLGGRGSMPPLALCFPTVWNGLASNAHLTWALRRADQVAFSTSPFRSHQGTALVLAHIRTLPPRVTGVERLELIGSRLLRELGGPLSAIGAEAKVGLVVGLPERMSTERGEGRGRAERLQIVAALSTVLLSMRLKTEVVAIPRGHASFAHVLIEAAVMLSGRRCDVVVVGGLDTAYDAEEIQVRINRRNIYDGENLDSACPGEGGAFFALTSLTTARRLGWEARAVFEGAATGREPGHSHNDVACMGLGLTQAARPLTEHLERDRRALDWWIHDVTNEHHRVHEMSLAWPRTCTVMGPEGIFDGLHAHLGDLGAAAMPTAVAIATEGFVRRSPLIGHPPTTPRPAATCLVTGCSEWEDRGAVLISRA